MRLPKLSFLILQTFNVGLQMLVSFVLTCPFVPIWVFSINGTIAVKKLIFKIKSFIFISQTLDFISCFIFIRRSFSPRYVSKFSSTTIANKCCPLIFLTFLQKSKVLIVLYSQPKFVVSVLAYYFLSKEHQLDPIAY